MDFLIDQEFCSWDEVENTQKRYEQEHNVIITIDDSHKIKENNAYFETLKYERVRFICKAGVERMCQSKRVRLSSTVRLNCPFDLRIGLQKGGFHFTDFLP